MADAACFYCGEMTSEFAGDPGMWPLVFSQPDGTGIARWHHARCVVRRLGKHKIEVGGPPCPTCGFVIKDRGRAKPMVIEEDS